VARAVVDLDEEVPLPVGQERSTENMAATVNAALPRMANQRSAARMLELLDETGTDLTDEAFRGAWRVGDHDGHADLCAASEQ
jgi:hypothetical protein